MIKNTWLITATAVAIGTAACQNPKQQQDENNKYQALATEAIEIHDEIMPQVSRFDRTSLKIDSILSNLEGIKEVRPDLDTTSTREDLKSLQTNIDAATDFMMEWMHEYGMAEGNTDTVVHKQLLQRVIDMKQQFEDVTAEINTKLKDFN